MHPIFKISSKVSPIFRRKRIQKFLKLFEPTSETQILDVGGLPACWQGVPTNAKITLLNLVDPSDAYDQSPPRPPIRRQSWATAPNCPTRTNPSDIVFSNSVIEHAGIGSQTNIDWRQKPDGWVKATANPQPRQREFFFEPH